VPAATAFGRWTPAPRDTCPAALHDRFAVVGPDGRRYPTWHPPTVVDPATGRPCTFGHEHGRDPRGSDLAAWLARHLSHPTYPDHGGIPFGAANEALDAFAAARPGTPARHEDHVGHKVEWENDVQLVAEEGDQLGVTCDVLTKLHQGTHSADALGNNVHELLYALRCTDGTELISLTLVPFGAANAFERSCAPGEQAAAGTALGFPSGTGARRIPDRACVERHVLVGAGQRSSYWALYESWAASVTLRTPDGAELAAFDAEFAVFNPARYGYAGEAGRIGRTVDACYETEANGDRANREPCEEATAASAGGPPLRFDDPRSPFDGAHRELVLGQNDVANAGGPRRWYTDPYGGRAASTPFPGAICQLVSPVASDRPRLARRLIGRERPYSAPGVHAPN
jgi:hypothetical protein